MPFCSECGHNNVPGSACASCGAALPGAPAVASPALAASAPVTASGGNDGMQQMMMMQMMTNQQAQNAAMVASASRAPAAPIVNNNMMQGGGGPGYGAPGPTTVIINNKPYCGWKSWICCLLGFPCIVCCPIDS
mmetsp:Transcript_1809/g.3757  ORF Transcript_1809/g.3757 Transcript_1809/m.3757 type:complete len:134 (+) Transcript_1809:82-483(+)